MSTTEPISFLFSCSIEDVAKAILTTNNGLHRFLSAMVEQWKKDITKGKIYKIYDKKIISEIEKILTKKDYTNE